MSTCWFQDLLVQDHTFAFFLPFPKEVFPSLSIKEGCILRCDKLLRPDVLYLAHEGHPGAGSMLQLIRRTCWWPNIAKDVKDFVCTCNVSTNQGHVLYCSVLLHCTVLYCTVLYYTILYYTVLYYTILILTLSMCGPTMAGSSSTERVTAPGPDSLDQETQQTPRYCTVLYCTQYTTIYINKNIKDV